MSLAITRILAAHIPVFLAATCVVFMVIAFKRKDQFTTILYYVYSASVAIVILGMQRNGNCWCNGCMIISIFCIAACICITFTFVDQENPKSSTSKPTKAKEQEAYDADNNYYMVEYEYTIIGGRMKTREYDNNVAMIWSQYEVPDSYDLTEEDENPNRKYIEFRLRYSGASRQYNHVLLSSTCPIVRDFNDDNGIVTFRIRFVVCKSEISIETLRANPDCIVICGNRAAGTVTIYATPHGIIEEVADWKTYHNDELGPLWRLLTNCDHSITGSIRLVDHSPMVSSEVIGDIYKLVTRYDPEYVQPYI